MPNYALTGSDTLVLNDRVLTDFAEGSVVAITFPNERIGKITGKNGNTVYSENTQGANAEMELRILVGSKDDMFLNGLSIQQGKDLPSFSLINGTFAKRIGDGQGHIKFVNYTLLGGVFNNNVETNENPAGETEQGVAVYKLFFASAQRAIV